MFFKHDNEKLGDGVKGILKGSRLRLFKVVLLILHFIGRSAII
jgi:hypothetical protein